MAHWPPAEYTHPGDASGAGYAGEQPVGWPLPPEGYYAQEGEGGAVFAAGYPQGYFGGESEYQQQLQQQQYMGGEYGGYPQPHQHHQQQPFPFPLATGDEYAAGLYGGAGEQDLGAQGGGGGAGGGGIGGAGGSEVKGVLPLGFCSLRMLPLCGISYFPSPSEQLTPFWYFGPPVADDPIPPPHPSYASPTDLVPQYWRDIVEFGLPLPPVMVFGTPSQEEMAYYDGILAAGKQRGAWGPSTSTTRARAHAHTQVHAPFFFYNRKKHNTQNTHTDDPHCGHLQRSTFSLTCWGMPRTGWWRSSKRRAFPGLATRKTTSTEPRTAG